MSDILVNLANGLRDQGDELTAQEAWAMVQKALKNGM
jgi:hypothetical protein